HSIWRDRARDYGGNFYTTVTGVKAETAATVFSVYPNPAASGLGLDVVLAKSAASATYTLRNMLGQTVASSLFMGSSTKVSTTGLAPGTYLLSVQPAGEAAVTARVTVE
ncbi:MAG: T9SS type A sorting domain-containing protein, partial [Hymenobacter sp.]